MKGSVKSLEVGSKMLFDRGMGSHAKVQMGQCWSRCHFT